MGNVTAWLMIVVGLVVAVGGFGMLWIDGILGPAMDAAGEDRAATYWSAGCSILVGLLLTYGGIRLRSADQGGGPPARAPGSGAASKRTCPDCGGLSPSSSPKCYHCGHVFRA